VVTVGGWRAQVEIERLLRKHDMVVVDSAPHAETEARIAVRAANLVLVPIQPSVMDLWATEGTLKLIRDEKRQGLIVLNRVPSRSKAAREVIAAAADVGVEVADCALGNRTALAASIASGKGVVETEPSGTAAQEVMALAEAIAAKLRGR
jgi:chromosome partitioning protein